MARPLRIQYKNAYYHVMNRGAGRKKIFRSDSHRALFLTVLAETVNRFHVVVHAYCLMDNHYHLLLSTPQANLDRVMRHINGVYTQRYNREVGTDGPLFRGRYKAIVIEVDSYLLRLSRYIHRNPLEANVTNRLERFRWSSYPVYLNKETKPGWLTIDTVLGYLPKRLRYEKYRAYVEMGVDEEIAEFYSKKKWSPVLGSKPFKQQFVENQSIDIREVPSYKDVQSPPQAEDIIQKVARHFEIPTDRIKQSRRGRGSRNFARQLAMYLCQVVGQMSLKEIAKEFSVGHYATVSKAVESVKRAVGEDEGLKRILNILIQDLTL